MSELRFGTAATTFDLPAGLPLAGNGGIGRPARGTARALEARALVLAQDGRRVALVVADLLSATGVLQAALQRRLGELPVLLLGTHTHHGPGGIFGPGYFAWLAAARPLNAPPLVEALADRMARAVRDAEARLAPGTVAYGEAECWGVARNAAPWASAATPPAGAPVGLSDAGRTVDPRVRVLVLTGSERAVFTTFGAHATALGPAFDHYHPDWPGVARATLEATGGWCAVAIGGAADVNVLSDTTAQGPGLAEQVARRVAGAIVAAVGAARPFEPALSLRSETVTVPPDLDWCVGAPALGGAEDGPSPLHRFPLAREGRTGRAFPPGHPHHPKVPALGPLQAWVRPRLPVPRRLPVHRIDLGGACLATVPGEPTVAAARLIEAAAGPGVVLPLGYAAEYAGYFTTAEEHARQAYEGASTLWGADSLGWLLDAHARLAKATAAA